MNKLWILLFLALTFSCKKSHKSNDSEQVNSIDVSDIINSDDYFGLKPKNKNSNSDSLSIKLIEMNDLNKDGVRDTVWIEHNSISQVYKIKFSCFKDVIQIKNVNSLQIKDINDLNSDGNNEMLMFLQSEESCWDEIILYSYLDKWVEKYKGLTYQCSETNNYQFRKLDDNTIQLTTYGVNKDSFDAELGDTLENVIPNAENVHVIKW